MDKRETQQARKALTDSGYTVVPYPDPQAPTKLIVKLGDRIITTLDVADGGVCEDSVRYLVSEAHYDRLSKPND